MSIKKICSLIFVAFFVFGSFSRGQNQNNIDTAATAVSNAANEVMSSFNTTAGGEKCGDVITRVGEACLEDKAICVPGNRQGVCCGTKLNTTVPFIGKCLQLVSEEDQAILERNKMWNTDSSTTQATDKNAFPLLMLGLTKILVTVILLASFIAIIVAGVMMAASGSSEEGYSKGTKLIGSIIAALALLGASGVILRLVNPNFFG